MKNAKLAVAAGIVAIAAFVAVCAVGSLAVLHLMAAPATAAAPTPGLAQLAITSQVTCHGGTPWIAAQVRYVSGGTGPASIAMVDAAGQQLPLITVSPEQPLASGGGTVAPGVVEIVMLDGEAPPSTDLSPVAPSCR